MPFLFDNLEVKIPIIIGTVPLTFSPTYPSSPGFMNQNLVVPPSSLNLNQTPITEPIHSEMSRRQRSDSNEPRE